jgi:hypothetical protein
VAGTMPPAVRINAPERNNGPGAGVGQAATGVLSSSRSSATSASG